MCTSAAPHSPLCSVEYAAGSLSSELRGAGGEEEQQFLNHGANVGGRHQSQGELQRTAEGTDRQDESSAYWPFNMKLCKCECCPISPFNSPNLKVKFGLQAVLCSLVVCIHQHLLRHSVLGAGKDLNVNKIHLNPVFFREFRVI